MVAGLQQLVTFHPVSGSRGRWTLGLGLPSLLLFSPGPRPMEWGLPYLGWVFSPQFTYTLKGVYVYACIYLYTHTHVYIVIPHLVQLTVKITQHSQCSLHLPVGNFLSLSLSWLTSHPQASNLHFGDHSAQGCKVKNTAMQLGGGGTRL